MSSNEELEEMIRHLQTRLVYLEGRVAQLEAGHRPYAPVHPTYYHKPKCGKCGMELSNVMGYVCADTYCPTFMNVTCGVGGVMSTTGG